MTREIPTPSTEVHFSSIVTPGPALIKPQHNAVVWQNVVTILNRDVWLQHFALHVQGTIDRSLLQFFRFCLDENQYHETIPLLVNDLISFDFGEKPVKFEVGNRVIRVKADILGDQSQTFQFYLKELQNFSFLDSDWLPIIPKVNGGKFRNLASGTQEVA